MTDEELQALVDKAVAEAIAPLQARLSETLAGARKSQGEADRAIVDGGIADAARKSGMFRPGAEDLVVEKAKAAGWTNAGGGLLRQLDDDGEIIGRDIGEWIQDNRGDLAALLLPGVIDPTDRAAFRKNLKAIADGTRQVGPLRRTA